LKTVTFNVIFQFLTNFNTRTRAVGAEAEAAARYGSDQMMKSRITIRLRPNDAAPAPQHLLKWSRKKV
jgi:hypothetical protein